ncbi:putative zinc finger BED domain-containing protein 6-like [Daphnia sinensis]|uniref:Zinc finger BED domain-containing protein 6-like n=1 Tax=Daphnia sinensis TaxID=1820382 RepID=A0AAD5PQ75_9CRUS|nr:putative zinc finger BED domain-containing protein 6-like [Daphnia sinensis]
MCKLSDDISRQNLYSHLSSKHPGLLSSFKAACLRGESQPKKRKCDEVVDLDGIENNPSKRQATIQESLTLKLRKPPKPVLTQEEFDNVVLNYVVDSVLPLRHVETDPFRELMKKVSPNHVVMCRKTLAKRLLAKYITAKEKIIDHLLKLNHVCTTADLWTAHGKSYVGMTCHWLHPTTFERNSICLAIRRVVG